MREVKASLDQAKDMLSQGEHAKALPLLHEAVLLAPEDFETRMLLGICLGMLKRTEEGVQELQRAVELNPNSSHAHYNLGVLLQSVGRLQEAAQNLERALWLNPEHEKARRALNAVRVLGQSTKPATGSKAAPSPFSTQKSRGYPAKETTRGDSEATVSRRESPVTVAMSPEVGIVFYGALAGALLVGVVLARGWAAQEYKGMGCGPMALLALPKVRAVLGLMVGAFCGVLFGLPLGAIVRVLTGSIRGGFLRFVLGAGAGAVLGAMLGEILWAVNHKHEIVQLGASVRATVVFWAGFGALVGAVASIPARRTEIVGKRCPVCGVTYPGTTQVCSKCGSALQVHRRG